MRKLKKIKVFYDMQLNRYQEQVEEIVEQSRAEKKMERDLKKIDEFWSVRFEKTQHKNSSVNILRVSEENFESLEEHQVLVQNMFASRFIAFFEVQVIFWQKTLNSISDITLALSDVQRSWTFLEMLFIHSEEVKKELPAVSEKFVDFDVEVKNILGSGDSIKLVKPFSLQENMLQRLETVMKQLEVCERALNEFLDGKKRFFTRFYFVSTTDLLDILSNNPSRIMKHMSKIFQAIQEFQLEEGGERPFAKTIISCVGTEQVNLTAPLKLIGKVEVYLKLAINGMQSTLKDIRLNQALHNQRTQ
jgi:dynein heavy chain